MGETMTKEAMGDEMTNNARSKGPLSDLLAKIKDHREHGAGSTLDLIETIVEELDQRMGEIDRRLMVAEEAPVDDWVEERENDPSALPCVARWELGDALQGQSCIERGPHERHRTAYVGGVMGEWSDPDRGEIVPRAEHAAQDAELRDEPSPSLMAEKWCAGRTLGQGYQDGFEAGVKAERGRIKR